MAGGVVTAKMLLLLAVAFATLDLPRASTFQICRHGSVLSHQYSLEEGATTVDELQLLQSWEDENNTMAGCLFHAMMEEYSVIKKSQLWIGNYVNMNASLLSSPSLNEEEMLLSAEDVCSHKEGSNNYMCGKSMKDMVDFAATKLYVTPDQLEALQPSNNIVAAGGGGEDGLPLMLRVSHVESKGKLNIEQDEEAYSESLSIVCHYLKYDAWFLCGLMEYMHYIKATLTDGSYYATTFALCPSSSSSWNEFVGCKWVTGENTVVWVVKDGGASPCVEEEEAATEWAVNGKLTRQKSVKKKTPTKRLRERNNQHSSHE